jgi:hypothetical protein
MVPVHQSNLTVTVEPFFYFISSEKNNFDEAVF